jgi:hypothetical protein
MLISGSKVTFKLLLSSDQRLVIGDQLTDDYTQYFCILLSADRLIEIL